MAREHMTLEAKLAVLFDAVNELLEEVRDHHDSDRLREVHKDVFDAMNADTHEPSDDC